MEPGVHEGAAEARLPPAPHPPSPPPPAGVEFLGLCLSSGSSRAAKCVKLRGHLFLRVPFDRRVQAALCVRLPRCHSDPGPGPCAPPAPPAGAQRRWARPSGSRGREGPEPQLLWVGRGHIGRFVLCPRLWELVYEPGGGKG